MVESAGDGAFCAGADRDEMRDVDPLSALDLRSDGVFDALARAPFVSIAAVHGPAVGGGFELALACDLRVAGPKARFWLPPSTSLIGSPRTMWPKNCVITRELPSLAVWIESSPEPIQLNGRKSVKSSWPMEPYA